MNTTDINQHRDTAAAAVLGVLVGLASLGAALDALLDATGHPVLAGLGLTLVVVLVATARGVARRVRERREDAADLLAGAAWRAEHMPQLAAQLAAQLEERDRAGVA